MKRPKHVLLLMPREIYILSRFMAACHRLGMDVTAAFEPAGGASWHLVTYRNGEYGAFAAVEVPAGDAPWHERLPALPVAFDAVVPTSEFSVQLAEHLGRQLGVFHNPIDAVDAYRNKYAMRRRFAVEGVSQPTIVARFSTLADVDEHPWDLAQFPMIAKPVDLTSSLYVRLVSGREEARGVYRRIFKHVQSFGGASFSGQGLLESYVPGPEFSAECVVDGGALAALFVTTKFVSPLPACDEIGHVCGADVSTAHRTAIEATARSVIRAWGVERAILHIEYKLCAGEAVVMEAACRIGGDFISELVELQFGVSLEEQLIRLRCGWPAELHHPVDRRGGEFFGIRFLFAKSSPVPMVDGVESVRTVRYGREALPNRDFGIHDRIGYEVIKSRSLAALIRYVGTDCDPNVHLDPLAAMA